MTDRLSRLSLTIHLQSTRAPWTSLLVLKSSQLVESLVAVPKGFVLKILRGSKCRTREGLFSEFARVLSFPEYFGHNWDALEECLADLEWLPAKGYVLVFTDADEVLPEDEEDYETFLEVISDAGEAWGTGQAGMGMSRGIPFHVIFAVTEQGRQKRAHWGIPDIAAEQNQQSETKRRSAGRHPKRSRKGGSP